MQFKTYKITDPEIAALPLTGTNVKIAGFDGVWVGTEGDRVGEMDQGSYFELGKALELIKGRDELYRIWLPDVTFSPSPIVPGLSPSQPTIFNEHGAGQSDSPYRSDLLPPLALLDLAKTLKMGAEKYGEDNWRKLALKDHINHALNHILAWQAGDRSDEHLNHAACRTLFALETYLTQPK